MTDFKGLSGAVIIEDLKAPRIRFTVADATSISKGTLMALTSERTAVAGTGAASQNGFAGIAAADKEASDGATTLALHTKGIFDLTYCNNADGIVGGAVKISGQNLITLANVTTDISGGFIVGRLLGTPAANEVVSVMVGG